jgi:hypothetical protein
MARTLMIEEEAGTVTRLPHAHNGYSAGGLGGTAYGQLRFDAQPTSSVTRVRSASVLR